jgi:DNA-binding transcriptional MocR family regulator
MDHDRRAVFRARLDLHRRAGQITANQKIVGEALLKRLGEDGRCDPSHQTLADDSGESISTVQRALKAFRALGMVSWVRRLVRVGWRVAQTSNAYLLTLGDTPGKPKKLVLRCDGQADRQTRKRSDSTVQPAVPVVSPAEQQEACAALARIDAQRAPVIQARLLTKGGVVAPVLPPWKFGYRNVIAGS